MSSGRFDCRQPAKGLDADHTGTAASRRHHWNVDSSIAPLNHKPMVQFAMSIKIRFSYFAPIATTANALYLCSVIRAYPHRLRLCSDIIVVGLRFGIFANHCLIFQRILFNYFADA